MFASSFDGDDDDAVHVEHPLGDEDEDALGASFFAFEALPLGDEDEDALGEDVVPPGPPNRNRPLVKSTLDDVVPAVPLP